MEAKLLWQCAYDSLELAALDAILPVYDDLDSASLAKRNWQRTYPKIKWCLCEPPVFGGEAISKR